MQVKIVRVIKFLFSAMTVSGSLAGELGVEIDFSAESKDGG
jgi:hypothetical protein